MTNFYLYYNIFEKKNLQQLLFLTFNKDTFNDETLNIIKIMYHFKNFKIMFGQPFLDNPDAINIDMFNQNVISTHIVKQIDSKLANMKNENKYDENELNQIIELIKIFTHPEIGITRNEFISEYKNSLEERLLNKFNPKLESELISAFTFNKIFIEQSLPMMERWKINVVDYGFSLIDKESFYLIRNYESIEQRKVSQDAFYGSEEWISGPEKELMNSIDTYNRIAHDVCRGILIFFVIPNNPIIIIRLPNLFHDPLRTKPFGHPSVTALHN